MAKPQKIMISIVAVMLYWLAAGGFSDGVCHRMQVEKGVKTTGSHVFIAEELPFALGFAVKEGTGFLSAANTAAGGFQQLQFYNAVICALEVEVACAVSQYVSQLNNNPVRIRKSDMLFPFHYFFEPLEA